MQHLINTNITFNLINIINVKTILLLFYKLSFHFLIYFLFFTLKCEMSCIFYYNLNMYLNIVFYN